MTASRLSIFPFATVVAALGSPLGLAFAQPAASQAPPAAASQAPPAAASQAPPAAASQAPEPPPPPATSGATPAASVNSSAPASVEPTQTAEVPVEAAAPASTPPPPPYPRASDELPPTPRATPRVHEPPLPAAYQTQRNGAPLPPPVPQHVAPRASFWAGIRPTVLLPLGSMWTDREPDGYYCCRQNPRPFSEFAAPGPGIGVDVGARFARNYHAFAFGEYSFLGAGPLEGEFGGQESVRTSIFGVGVRFSTHPDSIGFLIEMSVGYRNFEAQWKDGTTLRANDDLFSTRLGIGGVWQVNKNTSVEIMMLVGGGAFTDVEWTFPNGDNSSALSGYDDRGQYIPLGFQAGIHWDIIRTKD
jgi:hypothetical protein